MAARRKKKRPLNSRRTKAELMDAARWLVTRHGYDGVGARDMAARAGYDPVLLRRYFGSKQGIFEAAIRGVFDAKPLLVDAGAPLAARLARTVLEPTRVHPDSDPILLAVRAAASDDVRKAVALGLEREFIQPLAEELGARGRDGAQARAAAALAILAGFDLVRTVLGIEVLNRPQGRQLLLTLLKLCLDE